MEARPCSYKFQHIFIYLCMCVCRYVSTVYLGLSPLVEKLDLYLSELDSGLSDPPALLPKLGRYFSELGSGAAGFAGVVLLLTLLQLSPSLSTQHSSRDGS